MRPVNVEVELAEQAGQRLRDLDLVISRDGPGAGLAVIIPASTGEIEVPVLIVEGDGMVSTSRRAAMVGAGGGQAVLAQRHIPRGMGERYRALGWDYVDSGGNASLQFPGFSVLIEGRKPSVTRAAGSDRPSRAFRPAGLRVVFALLVSPDLVEATVRQLAAASTVSVGAAQATLADLRAEGFLGETGGRRLLIDVDRLADLWISRYVTDLLPRLHEERFEGPAPDWWLAQDEATWAGWDAALSGESAMRKLGYPLRPETALVYAPPPWHGVIRGARLRRWADPTVTVRERFWSPTELGSGTLAPSLLVYADALASGDPREIETAEEMRSTDEGLRRLSGRG